MILFLLYEYSHACVRIVLVITWSDIRQDDKRKKKKGAPFEYIEHLLGQSRISNSKEKKNMNNPRFILPFCRATMLDQHPFPS